jgi:hypothetical protein
MPAVGSSAGDEAMWIVFYVATIATLSAMGMVPALAPVETREDPERDL